jgi:dienelactone hydrolase
MAEVLLFHHALGLTSGCRAFADRLRAAGHTVHLPDLYEGKTFTQLQEGVAYGQETIGFETIIERGLRAADGLSEDIVYAGFSLGVMPAQKLAQTRPRARGAVLMHAAVPMGYFGDAWPTAVPLQIHTAEADPFGDVDEARALAAAVDGADLFLYPGTGHLFTDESTPDYDVDSTALVEQRLLTLLDRVERSA